MGCRKIGVTFFNNLYNSVSTSFMWNQARLNCFVGLVQGVVIRRTVNLRLLTSSQKGKATSDSNYRKLQRFFEQFDLPLQDISSFIAAKIPKPSNGYTLSMDRTNWQLGKRYINILTIGINVGKVCVPIVWKVLPQSTKQGNSNKKHRIDLMKELLHVFPAKDIAVLLMDREFLGKEWLSWLEEKDIGYVLRIKHNTVIGDKLASERGKARGRKSKERQNIWGLKLYFSSKSIPRGREERLYVVSNRHLGKEALDLYRLRWGIELLFSHLKKRGFRLEDTHMTGDRKLEKLMTVVSLSFLFTYGWGLELRKLCKQTAHIKRRSDFRYGLDQLEEMLTNPEKEPELYRKFLEWIESGNIKIDR